MFSKDGARVWVSSEIGGSVAVIDPATRKIVKKIRFDIPGLTKQEIQPVGIRLTSDGKTAFVALGPANRVAVIDAQTFEVEKYLLVGARVWQLALTPDEKLLLRDQWQFQRCVGDRRGEPESGQDHCRRRGAHWRCGLAEMRRRGNAERNFGGR